MREAPQTVRVLFSCTGVGIFNRGIESFFREAFDGLKDTPGMDAWLIKGAGKRTEREIPVWCLPRTGRFAKWLGWLFNRNSYAAEQWSSFFSVCRQIRRLRPHVIFYSDANLGFQLFFRRKWIGVPYQLLFSNGGPVFAPFDRTDFVHQVAPLYHAKALEFGEPATKHFMVPYGIRVPPPPVCDADAKRSLRARLQMPADRPVVLSVGAINRYHKRMHYVVDELSRLREPRPFLQMVGAFDEESPGVLKLAERLLGSEDYSVRSVPYSEVFDFYRAADIFVLGSLQEGFGRVYLEALMHGLPVIAHRHPVMEYVLGCHGIFGDLSRPGELAALLSQELGRAPNDDGAGHARWESVQTRFSWPALTSQYYGMFRDVFDRSRNHRPVVNTSRHFTDRVSLHGTAS
jgi:1,2-diacylglycerol 3-alpha-glucosyltransferase